jgi:hypothetical protein
MKDNAIKLTHRRMWNNVEVWAPVGEVGMLTFAYFFHNNPWTALPFCEF